MDDLITEIVWEDGEEQLRMQVSEFRGKQYFSIRIWYLDFDSEWHPTDKGFTVPYDANVITYLADSLSKLMSKAESELFFPSLTEV